MCVTQVSDNNQLVLHIVNYGYQPVKLEKGQLLGTLEYVNPVTVDGTVKLINLLKYPEKVKSKEFPYSSQYRIITFINGFYKVAEPLSSYKEGYVWNDKCLEAFVQLKELLTGAPC